MGCEARPGRPGRDRILVRPDRIWRSAPGQSPLVFPQSRRYRRILVYAQGLGITASVIA